MWNFSARQTQTPVTKIHLKTFKNRRVVKAAPGKALAAYQREKTLDVLWLQDFRHWMNFRCNGNQFLLITLVPLQRSLLAGKVWTLLISVVFTPEDWLRSDLLPQNFIETLSFILKTLFFILTVFKPCVHCVHCGNARRRPHSEVSTLTRGQSSEGWSSLAVVCFPSSSERKEFSSSAAPQNVAIWLVSLWGKCSTSVSGCSVQESPLIHIQWDFFVYVRIIDSQNFWRRATSSSQLSHHCFLCSSFFNLSVSSTEQGALQKSDPASVRRDPKVGHRSVWILRDHFLIFIFIFFFFLRETECSVMVGTDWLPCFRQPAPYRAAMATHVAHYHQCISGVCEWMMGSL